MKPAAIARSRAGPMRPFPTGFEPMIRDVARLASSSFDVVIVGGGIYGACAAWDATLRGLSVALVEGADFAHATSSQSLKVVHGGLRYLQHADIRRLRVSDRERTTLMRIAPHLVHRLPVLLPTYRTGIQRRPIIAAALATHELLSCDRNFGVRDLSKRIPCARLVSRDRCLRFAPGLPKEEVTGGALYYDGQMYNSERLCLAFIQSAADHGACVANYVDASAFLRRGDRITGIVGTDLRTGATIEIAAAAVLNAAGPWVDRNLRAPGGLNHRRATTPHVKTINLVTRPLAQEHAIALTVPRRSAGGKAGAGSRLVYIAPWRHGSIVGSAHFFASDGTNADACSATETEIAMFLDDVNAAYPAASLDPEDITFVRCRLVPSQDANSADPYRTARHHRIVDHGGEGAEGLFSVIGVKYTTARYVAENAISLVARKLARRVSPARSARVPVCGGAIESFDAFLADAVAERRPELSEEAIRQLVRNHGSEYRAVLGLAQDRPELLQPVSSSSPVLKAQVAYAIKHEMAQTLDDVVFRRTELATAGHPGSDALLATAQLMGEELGWDADCVAREVNATERLLAIAHARPGRS
jgi:glycerol-3-phosphate dehydrogenase